MIDAFVAAYLKGSEEELDRKAEVQAERTRTAFHRIEQQSQRMHFNLLQCCYILYIYYYLLDNTGYIMIYIYM